MVSPTTFALASLAKIEQDLSALDSTSSSVFAPCGHENISILLAAVRRHSLDYTKDLSELCLSSHNAMKETRNNPALSLSWRRLYTETTLIWALLDVIYAKESTSGDETYWENVIERLDNAIIIAGAPGEGRLDLVLDSIEHIQSAFLSPGVSPSGIILVPSAGETDQGILPSASHAIPVLPAPPSMSVFRSKYSRAPFILRAFAQDWPAVQERKWAFKEYLQRAAGRGRVVPVEIGNDYRTEDWTQRMMKWDEFLDYLFLDNNPTCGPENSNDPRRETLYLAQHDLFKQFPMLREDVVVPDYVYVSLPQPQHYPQYRPPGNDEELILNVWIGPQGAASPAHVDPYFNLYTQVIGRKTVWIAPPSVSHVLSPLSDPTITNTKKPSPLLDNGHLTSTVDANQNGTMLSNTSRLDVFAPSSDLQRDHDFVEKVKPTSMSAVLEEGDMLFFPPGWWHAMRSESTSFSVSMWF